MPCVYSFDIVVPGLHRVLLVFHGMWSFLLLIQANEGEKSNVKTLFRKQENMGKQSRYFWGKIGVKKSVKELCKISISLL